MSDPGTAQATALLLGVQRGEAVAVEADRLLDLDAALTGLAQRHPRMARVVECRYFGGMTVEETVAALDVSLRTVEREWTRAKAHLYHALQPPEETPPGAEDPTQTFRP